MGEQDVSGLVERVARVLFSRSVYHGYNDETLRKEWDRTAYLHRSTARAALTAIDPGLLDGSVVCVPRDAGWRSMETAPKDGSFMLLLFGDDRVRLGAWERHEDSSYPFAWKDVYGSVIVRGWKDDEEPARWHPLPDIPAATRPLERE